MKYKKIKIEPGRYSFKLGDYPIYVEHIYDGREPFKVVGIREDQLELEGDYSGIGIIIQKDWIKKEDCFLVSTVCEEQLKPNGCQIHNVNCCGGGSLLTKHVDKYWESLID